MTPSYTGGSLESKRIGRRNSFHYSLDVMTLPPFRYLGFYAFQVCASIFWASLAARFISRFVPAAKIPTLFVVAALGVSLDTFRLTIQLRRGKPSGFAVFCFSLALFSVIYAVVLVIGGVIEHYIGGGWGYLFDWYGFVFGGMYVLFYTSLLTHQHALEEDEKHRELKPGEEEELRRYKHPYI
jgi:MFS family permease